MGSFGLSQAVGARCITLGVFVRFRLREPSIQGRDIDTLAFGMKHENLDGTGNMTRFD